MKPLLVPSVLICIVAVVSLMKYACVSSCSGSFISKGGLTRHQNACALFWASRALKLEHRRLIATQSKQQSQVTSCPRKPSPVAPQVGPSTSAAPETVGDIAPAPVSRSVVRRPQYFRDELPTDPGPLPIPPIPAPQPILTALVYVQDFFRSTVNSFHILREYLYRPSYDPDTQVQKEDLANYPMEPQSTLPSSSAHPSPPWPFENMSKYLLMNWFYSGGNLKSAPLTGLKKTLRPFFGTIDVSQK